MKKISTFQRFINNIKDFEFSNQFIREKTGIAIKYMLTLYLVFVLILGILAMIFILPNVKDTSNAIGDAVRQMPEFTVNEDQLSFNNGETYHEYGNSDIKIIVDLANEHPDAYYGERYDSYYTVRANGFYTRGNLIIDFKDVYDLEKSKVVTFLESFSKVFMIALIFASALGIIGVFIISAFAWAVVIIVNGFMRKDIQTNECYRIGIYSMTMPSIGILVIWIMNIALPYFSIIYIGIIGIYAYRFIKAYEPTKFEIDDLYETLD